MLNYLCKYFAHKEIVLYISHRQTIPIINNPENKKNYLFLNIMPLWRIFPLPGRFKLKFKFMYLILSIVNPKYILDINWISKWNSLYKIWTKKHKSSKYIVVQHGSYVAGIVKDKKHRYTKCDVFLTWSDYFTRIFKSYNEGKKVKIITFGNPIYNRLDRSKYSYVNRTNKKILVLPSAILMEKLAFYTDLFNKLENLGLNVFLKEHNAQGSTKIIDGKKVHFPIIENVEKINGNIEHIIKNNDFDLIISDHSTALLDAVYFKNKVLYFSPDFNEVSPDANQYSKYLENLYLKYKNIKKTEDLYNYVSVEAQELLFANMISEGNNVLNKNM